jgi:hypothetical protein
MVRLRASTPSFARASAASLRSGDSAEALAPDSSGMPWIRARPMLARSSQRNVLFKKFSRIDPVFVKALPTER